MNYAMRGSEFCYIHTFGHFRKVPFLKNSTIHFLISLLVALIVFLHTLYFGPTKKAQQKVITLLEKMQRIDETDHEKLIKEYPLGYVLFAIRDSDMIVTASTNRLQKEWRVDWNRAKIVQINEKMITFIHPAFYSKDGKRSIVENIIGIARKERTVRPVIKAFGIELFYALLIDDTNGIICLLGLKGR